MKFTQLLVIAFFIINLKPSYEQTQGEMNHDVGIKYHAADSELNAVYRKILTTYSDDTLFIKEIKIAQSLWVQLREAEVNARYLPGKFYGSVEPMCRLMLLEDLTRERTKCLKIWIDGDEEGDACEGTIKKNSNFTSHTS
jgi:uncharacterized protein YecT (DUF1311 family)